MIIGIGIDMIEVSRVGEKIDRDSGFREKVFSKSEIIFCDSRPNKHQHYAGRFAAKEAFLKAAGQGLQLTFNLCDIEVVQDESGKPGLLLHNDVHQRARASQWNKIHLSISHIQSAACAVVVIEM